MKPKDLKYPFSWEERQVLLKDHILYVPDYYTEYQNFTFPEWESDEVFGNKNPVYVEYCSGNGTWIYEKAKENPDINWVAIERDFDRVRKIHSKRTNGNIKNLFIVSGEALTTSKYFFKSEAVEKIFINFPDPWPKDRHAKHRLMKPRFIEEMARVLKVDGSCLFVTDHEGYCTEGIESFLQVKRLSPCVSSPYYISDRDNYGTSYFDTLWRSMGKKIHFVEFKKNPEVVEPPL